MTHTFMKKIKKFCLLNSETQLPKVINLTFFLINLRFKVIILEKGFACKMALILRCVFLIKKQIHSSPAISLLVKHKLIF